MAQKNDWTSKVLVIIKGGNTDAAVAQIKVAPSVKDIKALHAALIVGQLMGRWPVVDQAVVQFTYSAKLRYFVPPAKAKAAKGAKGHYFFVAPEGQQFQLQELRPVQ